MVINHYILHQNVLGFFIVASFDASCLPSALPPVYHLRVDGLRAGGPIGRSHWLHDFGPVG